MAMCLNKEMDCNMTWIDISCNGINQFIVNITLNLNRIEVMCSENKVKEGIIERA